MKSLGTDRTRYRAGLNPSETSIVRVTVPANAIKHTHKTAAHLGTAYPYRPRYKRYTMPCAAAELYQTPEKTPEPRTDTDITEGVVVDSTASVTKSSKRVTAYSDASALSPPPSNPPRLPPRLRQASVNHKTRAFTHGGGVIFGRRGGRQR